jgi:spoIIIJ-associated protein
MMKWIEATGKNEEAAIASALSQLGMDRDDVSVEVLERAKRGFLGIGSAPARIKVTYEVPDPIVEKAPAAAPVRKEPIRQENFHKKEDAKKQDEGKKHENKRHPEPKPAPIKEEAKPAPVQETPVVSKPEPIETAPAQTEDQDGEIEAKIKEFLTGLLAQMGVAAEPQISVRPEGGYQVVIEGEKLGALIGHRGETLDAIQQLTNYSVNRNRTGRVRIHIDVENYRAKREESLQHLAQKVAGKVVKYRRNITLEPMNAYERHVIHEALQEYPDVITYSTGTEPNRRTVVAFTKGKHSY